MRNHSRKLSDLVARGVEEVKIEASYRKASAKKALTINLKPQRKRPTRPLALKTVLGLFLSSLGITLFGMFSLWPRLAGVPAHMTVTHCILNTGKGAQCHGVSPVSGDTVLILGADPKDVGHDIDVHATGGLASADSYWGFFVTPALGVILAGGGMYVMRIRRRELRRWGPPEIPRTPGTEWIPPQ
jgi:hypothetical protein